MILSHSRGHEIYYDGSVWRYCDTNEIDFAKRACKRCGRMPTDKGFDACLGYIDGVKSACCGHGAEKGFAVDKDGNHIALEEWLQKKGNEAKD